MYLSGDTIIDLGPPSPVTRLTPLIAEWQKADFEPSTCRAVLESYLERLAFPARWFQPDELLNDGFAASDELLFYDALTATDWEWQIGNCRQNPQFSADVPVSVVQSAAHFTRSLPRVEFASQFEPRLSTTLRERLKSAVNRTLSQTSDFGRWPDLLRPGIYRREHASIAIRSSSATILFDPLGYSGRWTAGLGRYPSDRGARVDAVVITRGHPDNWHLPSVLRHCDENTLVVVPRVPRVNLLTPLDFSAALATAGQKHIGIGWHEKIAIGDIQIEALPLFGSQANECAPCAKDGLKTWGNCYSIKSQDFSALMVADCGSDPIDATNEVVLEAIARNGRYDVVLSSCLNVSEVAGTDLPMRTLAVPFNRLREIRGTRESGRAESATRGVENTAEICAIANARYFLPYAHGFNALDDYAGTEGPARIEPDLLLSLEIALRRKGAQTTISHWSLGDRFPIGEVTLPDR